MSCDAVMPLQSVEEYRVLKDGVKQRLGKLESNCYLGGGALKTAIAEGRAQYRVVDSGLLIFVDEGAYDRLYYFLGAGLPFPAIRHGKLLILEEVDSGGRNSKKIASLGRGLIALGWSLEAENVQVSTELAGREDEIGAALQAATMRLNEHGIKLRACDALLGGSVAALWREHLKIADVPGSHFDFMNDPTQEVICAIDVDGALCGVNWWQCVRGMCEIRHTVTSPEHLHQGIGYAVLAYALSNACASGCRAAFTYIDRENYKSLGLYRKIGMVENGRTSTQFVLAP